MIAQSFDLASIIVPDDRARSLDPAWVAALARLIEEQGLINPITLRQTARGLVLITGLHRLEAVRSLGRKSIVGRLSAATSDDAARLEEVMENLGRYDLIALDRCHHLYELKRVWERIYPETKAGVAGGKARQGSAGEIFSFAAATAEKIGLSQRAIQMAVKIWTDLTPVSRRRLVGTGLAAKQTELKALSEQKPATQARILDLILGDDRPEDGPENVAQALEYLANGKMPTPAEKQFLGAKRTLVALDDTMFDLVIAAVEDRVIASLKRKGRI